MYFMDCGVDI